MLEELPLPELPPPELVLDLASGERVSAFGANLGQRVLEPGSTVNVAGRLVRDRFRGGDAAEIRIQRLES